MHRITASLDDDVVALIDAHMARHGATNRSEAIRDIVRTAAAADHAGAPPPGAACVATLTWACDPDRHGLGARLHGMLRDAHDLVTSVTQTPLSHVTVLEVAVLKGETAAVQALASAIMRERGVRHGRLCILPAELRAAPHDHGDGHPHSHVSV
jgi:CopG family nickel-responsive transcriptional regulator